MTFSQEQNAELAKPLDAKHVKGRKQSGRTVSYVEGWHVIAEANRIFGFDGWARETVELIENTAPTKNANGNHVVSFRAKVRVTAGAVTREGIGFGSGISSDIHDAYEGAIKEAETDAMKRALMTFGNPFGLALYDKTQANVTDDRTPQQPAATPATGPGVSASTFAARIDAANTINALETIRADLKNTDESVVSQQQFDALWADIDHKIASMGKPNGKSAKASLDALDTALGSTPN